MKFWCSIAMCLAWAPFMPVFAYVLRLGVMGNDTLWCSVGLFGFAAASCLTAINLWRAWSYRNT